MCAGTNVDGKRGCKVCADVCVCVGTDEETGSKLVNWRLPGRKRKIRKTTTVPTTPTYHGTGATPEFSVKSNHTDYGEIDARVSSNFYLLCFPSNG